MQRTEIQLEDDLTGGPADETIAFVVNGMGYEVDLSTRHAADFRRQLAPFVEHARLERSQRPRIKARTTASRERSRTIRSWAERQGLIVADHGRLPRSVIEDYEAAHNTETRESRSSRGRSAGRGTTPKAKNTEKLSTRRRSGR